MQGAIIDPTMLRRTLFGLAPALVMAGTRRPWKQVERMIETGSFKGRLSVDDLPTPALDRKSVV